MESVELPLAGNDEAWDLVELQEKIPDVAAEYKCPLERRCHAHDRSRKPTEGTFYFALTKKRVGLTSFRTPDNIVRS